MAENNWGAAAPEQYLSREEMMQKMLQQAEDEKRRLMQAGGQAMEGMGDRLSGAYDDMTAVTPERVLNDLMNVGENPAMKALRGTGRMINNIPEAVDTLTEGSFRDRLSGAYDDLTEPTMGDRFQDFADGINAPEQGLMGQIGNTWDKAKKRTSRAVETLTAPEPKGLMDMLRPEEPSMGERAGSFMDNAKGLMDSYINPEEQASQQMDLSGRRVGDVWIEEGILYHLTKDGLQKRSAQ
jgi:hypothetical protein